MPAGDRRDATGVQPSTGEALLGAADVQDLREQLVKANRRKSRHGLWLLLGMSPSALIPFVGLSLGGSTALVLALVVLVILVEAYQWLRAQGDVTELNMQLALAEQRARGEESP